MEQDDEYVPATPSNAVSEKSILGNYDIEKKAGKGSNGVVFKAHEIIRSLSFMRSKKDDVLPGLTSPVERSKSRESAKKKQASSTPVTQPAEESASPTGAVDSDAHDATSPRSGEKTFAIKQIDISEKKAEASAFLESAAPTLKELGSHKNLIRYSDFFIRENYLYLVSEFQDCGSLFDLVHSYGPFNEQMACAQIAQALKALEHLHRHKIVHGNLKAANMMLNRSCTCKVGDYGLSSFLQATCKKNYLSVDSPFWMAPEVLKEGDVGFAADIWSLGCTMVELLTGAPPYWSGGEPMLAIYRILEPTSAVPLPANVSPEVKSLLSQCLMKNPVKRSTAEELLHHPVIKKALATIDDKDEDSRGLTRQLRASLSNIRATLYDSVLHSESALGKNVMCLVGLDHPHLLVSPSSLFHGAPVQSACGGMHVLLLTDTKRLYSWGSAKSGQLGHGDKQSQTEPKKIDALAGLNISRIACSAAQSAVVTETGELYMWGWNGVLWNGKLCSKPALVELDMKVSEVVLGKSFVMLIDFFGNLYSFGDNSKGQLGYETPENKISLKPQMVTIPGLQHIVQVAAGDDTVLLLDEKGFVYQWGCDPVTLARSCTPTKVEPLQNCVGVSVGLRHLMAVNDSGVVFTWGNGRHGVLGHGNEDDCTVPTAVEFFITKKMFVTHVCAGNFHSVARTKDGHMYSWGNGKHFKLGFPVAEFTADPRRVASVETQNVVHFSCGANMSTIILGPRLFGVDVKKLSSNITRIPRIVVACIGFLENYLKTEYLFKTPGDPHQVRILVDAFERGQTNLNDAWISPHAVATMLKVFLRRLPRPILSYQMYPQLAQLSGTTGILQRFSKFRSMLKSLPKPNLLLLQYLLRFLNRVAKEPANKMTSSSLTHIFRHVITRPHPSEQTTKSDKVGQLVADMIEFGDLLFSQDSPCLVNLVNQQVADIKHSPSSEERRLKRGQAWTMWAQESAKMRDVFLQSQAFSFCIESTLEFFPDDKEELEALKRLLGTLLVPSVDIDDFVALLHCFSLSQLPESQLKVFLALVESCKQKCISEQDDQPDSSVSMAVQLQQAEVSNEEHLEMFVNLLRYSNWRREDTEHEYARSLELRDSLAGVQSIDLFLNEKLAMTSREISRAIERKGQLQTVTKTLHPGKDHEREALVAEHQRLKEQLAELQRQIADVEGRLERIDSEHKTKLSDIERELEDTDRNLARDQKLIELQKEGHQKFKSFMSMHGKRLSSIVINNSELLYSRYIVSATVTISLVEDYLRLFEDSLVVLKGRVTNIQMFIADAVSKGIPAASQNALEAQLEEYRAGFERYRMNFSSIKGVVLEVCTATERVPKEYLARQRALHQRLILILDLLQETQDLFK